MAKLVFGMMQSLDDCVDGAAGRPEGTYRGIAEVQAHVRTGRGTWAEGFLFCNGKITEYRSFGERVHALEWAGIQGEAI